jgi:hypothetical protein
MEKVTAYVGKGREFVVVEGELRDCSCVHFRCGFLSGAGQHPHRSLPLANGIFQRDVRAYRRGVPRALADPIRLAEVQHPRATPGKSMSRKIQAEPEKRCVVCGCTNHEPCIGGPMGTCWFTHLDEVSGAGLCSQCAALPLADLEISNAASKFVFAGNGMRPHDLAPASVLALRHKHGTIIRYMSGCHCWRCRRGNREYKRRLDHERKLYGPNDLVTTERVLAHLRYLQTFGIGHKTVGKHARVAKTSLAKIIWYGRQHIRRRSEARILAIQPSLETLPRNVNIPAGETIEKIRQLTWWGYPKSLITRDGLGNLSIGLQVNSLTGKTSTTTVRTAVDIRNFHALIVAMRHAWEEKRGAIPPRHFVYWKKQRGKRPAVPTVERLDLRPSAYNILWSKELKEVSSLNRKLKKALRESRGDIDAEKQAVGPAQSSVRDILEELAEKKDNDLALPRTIEKAKAVANVAQAIVNSAKVEVDYLKVTGRERASTPFLEETDKPALPPGNGKGLSTGKHLGAEIQ